MRQSRWYFGRGLGDIVVNDTESNVVRTVGVPGSRIKPGRSYLDQDGTRVEISGYSATDGGYLGFDASGVFRVYDHNGQCIALSTGESNLERTIKNKKTGEERTIPHNPRYDLRVE